MMSDTNIFGLDQYFYHASVRRYVALFGTIFSDLYIKRTSGDGNSEDTIKVPIQYASGNMYLKAAQSVQIRENKQISRILPSMAYSLQNIYKDISRKTNPMNRLKGASFDANNQKQFQYNRIPYNLLFDLIIRTKNTDDMLQLVEQIVPAFDGNLSVTIQDSTGVEVEQDIVISLEEISMSDDFDEEMQARLIEYKITFELKGYLYKRTQTGLVVKDIDLQFASMDDPSIVYDGESYTEKYPIQAEQDNLNKMVSAVDTLGV